MKLIVMSMLYLVANVLKVYNIETAYLYVLECYVNGLELPIILFVVVFVFS